MAFLFRLDAAYESSIVTRDDGANHCRLPHLGEMLLLRASEAGRANWAAKSFAGLRLGYLALGVGRTFEFAFAGRLVKAKPLENRRAHLDAAALPLVSPVGEFDLRYQFGLHEVHLPVALNFAEEGIAICLQRVQPFPRSGVSLLGKAAARLANRNQTALIVIEP